MRQFRIGRAHRGDQRIHHLALDAVVEMAGIRDILEAAPAVGDFLVLGERVGDQRKGALIGLEGLRQRVRRRLALLAGAVLQQVQRRLDRKLLAADLEAQRRDGLVEQPVPGGIAGLRLLVEQLLDAVLELIGLVLAQILDPRPVIAELGRAQSTARRPPCSRSRAPPIPGPVRGTLRSRRRWNPNAESRRSRLHTESAAWPPDWRRRTAEAGRRTIAAQTAGSCVHHTPQAGDRRDWHEFPA